MYAHQLIGRWPIAVQRPLLNIAMRMGLAPRFAFFRMLSRTLIEIGAEQSELDEAFGRCADLQASFVLAFRAVAERLAGQQGDRRASYRAAVYALVADWATSDPKERERNYAIAVPAFEAFAQGHEFALSRVKVPFRSTSLSAYWMQPPNPTNAVLLVPGNDEVKEWMVPMANAACARGLAALVVDLPGYSESFFAGSRFDGRESLHECAVQAFAFLANKGIKKAGVFGVSFGGMLAHVIAALEPKFSASAGLGGPVDLAWLWRHVPYLQLQRFVLTCGSRDAAAQVTQSFDVERALAAGAAPALVLHGTADEVVPLRDAKRLKELMGARAELRLVAGGDHMANPRLGPETEHVMDWLVRQLAS